MIESPPFSATAKTPIEFIPPSQDAEKLKRVRLREIEQREQAIDREAKALAGKAADMAEAEHRDAVADLDAMRVGVQKLRAALDADLAAMREKFPEPQKFFLLVPTSVEREQINSRLIMLGLQQVTAEIIRASMIEELFHVDWSEPGRPALTREENLAIAEEAANFLDSVWMRQQAHDTAVAEWQEQEVERIKDYLNGAPLAEQMPQPIKVISVREQARLTVLMDRMMQRPRMRSLAAQNMDFGRQNAMMLVRMHLAGVDFVPPEPIDRDPRTNAVSESAVAALREVVDDDSWTELVTYIDRLYVVDEAERKNSDSLPEKPSHPDGSIEPIASPGSNGGSSTGSSSEPAPAAGSAMTTEASSGSTSGSEPAPVSTAASSSLTGAP